MNFKFVFDTNALISASLIKNSINSLALDHALEIGILVISKPTLQELADVIYRKKFDRYFLSDAERQDALNRIEVNSIMYVPDVVITDCRDKKDNKYLELAISAAAACIITGDLDLLVLNPYRSISIISAADFLKQF